MAKKSTKKKVKKDTSSQAVNEAMTSDDDTHDLTSSFANTSEQNHHPQPAVDILQPSRERLADGKSHEGTNIEDQSIDRNAVDQSNQLDTESHCESDNETESLNLSRKDQNMNLGISEGGDSSAHVSELALTSPEKVQDPSTSDIQPSLIVSQPQPDHMQPPLEPSQGSSETPVPSTSEPKINLSKPGKRLTLQERLALAAKGKSKKLSADKHPSDKNPSELANSEPSSTIATAAPSPVVLSPVVGAVKGSLSSLKLPELGMNQASENDDSLRVELKRLEAENTSLKAQIVQATKTSAPNSRDSDLASKLAAKEETIKQLMLEGEALSMKELKLYESVKKLKAQNTVLEENLHSFAEKDVEKSQLLAELNSFLKANAFKTTQDLVNAYKEAIKKADKAKFDLDKAISYNWEARFNEQAQMFKEEADAKVSVLKELSDLKIQSEMTRRKLTLELESKAEQIGDLKAELAGTRTKSAMEISRLENKIEALRLNSELSSTAPSDSFTMSSGSDELRGVSILGASLKSMDFKDFAKLSDAHHNLQQQYLSAQENWKLIESNLINQVELLKQKIEALKKTNAKLSLDNKRVNCAFSEQSSELSNLEARFNELQSKYNDAIFENKMKDGENMELASKSEKIRTVFDHERDTFTLKITSLEEEIRELNHKLSFQEQQELRPPFQSRKPSFPVPGYPMGSSPSGFPRLKSSQASIEQQAMFYNPQWDEIQVGESHLTSFNSANREGDLEKASNDSGDTEHFGSGGRASSLIPGSSSNNQNIHLISKMGNKVRRLEVELITLRDENSELSRQKELLERDLLDRFALDGQVASLTANIEKLEADLAKVDAEKHTMLELIGEKSEQVEELRADVFDLKEICRSQVTQMIEMQELRT